MKKIIFISLILFFASAGNVFSADLGDVYRSEIIGEFMDESCAGTTGYAIVWYSNNNPTTIGLFYVECEKRTEGNGPKTFGEIWGVEQNDNNIYTFRISSIVQAMACVSTLDFSTCSAYSNRSDVMTLRADPVIPILTMPETASTDLLGNVGGLFSNFWPVISIMFGVPLSFYIIPKVIALIPK